MQGVMGENAYIVDNYWLSKEKTLRFENFKNVLEFFINHCQIYDGYKK